MTTLYDLAVIIGIGSVAYAGYLLHPALPWLICGLASTGWGVFGAMRSIKKGRNK